MNTEALRHMAKLLRELHADGTLVLPNAWDAAITPAVEVSAMTAPPPRPTLIEVVARCCSLRSPCLETPLPAPMSSSSTGRPRRAAIFAVKSQT